MIIYNNFEPIMDSLNNGIKYDIFTNNYESIMDNFRMGCDEI